MLKPNHAINHVVPADEKIDYDSMSIGELAAMLKNVKNSLDSAAEVKSSLQKEYDYISMTIIPERMEDEDIESIKVKGVGRLQTKHDIRCSVLAANKDAVQKWLKDHGHGSMISPTVNASTLKAFVRERMKEGKEYPADLLEIHPYTRASVVNT